MKIVLQVFQCTAMWPNSKRASQEPCASMILWRVHRDGVEKVIQLTIWCDGVRNDLTYYRSATTLQTWCGFLSASYCSRHCSPFKVNHFHIIHLLVWKILSSREMYFFRTIYYACRGVNSFLKLGWGASSNAAYRCCPAAPSILPKYGGQLPPYPPPLTPLRVNRKYIQLIVHENDLLFRYLSHHLTWQFSSISEDLHRFARNL